MITARQSVVTLRTCGSELGLYPASFDLAGAGVQAKTVEKRRARARGPRSFKGLPVALVGSRFRTRRPCVAHHHWNLRRLQTACVDSRDHRPGVLVRRTA